MSITRDDVAGLHTGDCALIGEPYGGTSAECDCDPREMLSDQLVQDARDGAALRRLREALPVSVGQHAYIDAIWNGRPDASFVVVVRTYGDDRRSIDITRKGTTIAEAADACREALSGPPSGTA